MAIQVKSHDLAVKAQREASAQRVIDHFPDRLPLLRLFCFFDDEDWQPFKGHWGKANRGFYTPIKENTFNDVAWPDYVTECIFVDDPASASLERVFDHVIYLHGSTCVSETGLTMTFAHELQHFVQHSNVRRLWAENTLIQNLPKYVINALRLKWSDIPIEREARIVAKRTAESLCGSGRVREYVEVRITEAVNADDADDWRFVQGLVASTSCDLADETRLISQRLKPYRSQLEELLQEVKDDLDFGDIDLNALLDGASTALSGSHVT